MLKTWPSIAKLTLNNAQMSREFQEILWHTWLLKSDHLVIRTKEEASLSAKESKENRARMGEEEGEDEVGDKVEAPP